MVRKDSQIIVARKVAALGLTELVAEAFNVLGYHFPAARLELSIQDDLVCISVFTSLSVQQAYLVIKEFDYSWWLDRWVEYGDLLNINLEFE